MSKTCPICLKQFLPKTSFQIHCSKKCTKRKWVKKNWRKVLDYNNALARKKTHLNWKEKNCTFCNKLFLPDIRHKYAIYCCVGCRIKANYYNSKKTGRYYKDKRLYRERHKNELRKKDLEYKARIRFGVTSKTLNRKIVIDRDGGLCQLCGKQFEVIHHIEYSGKPEDLVCLCRSCHAWIHS